MMLSPNGWQVAQLPLARIRLDPKNRKTEEGIEEMMEAMKEHGQLVPVIVVPYFAKNGAVLLGAEALKNRQEKQVEYWLNDGERRYRAALRLGWKALRAEIKTTRITWIEAHEIQFIANAKRMDMNPVDMAEAVSRYIDEYRIAYPKSHRTDAMERLQSLTSFSRTHLENRLAILWSPSVIQEQIRRRQTRANIPVEIKHNIPEKYQEAAFERVRRGKSVNTLEFRTIGKQIKAIESLPLADEEKTAQVAAVMRSGGRISYEETDAPGAVDRYLAEVSLWRARLLKWNLEGFTDKDLDRLGAAVNEVYRLFLNIRRREPKETAEQMM